MATRKRKRRNKPKQRKHSLAEKAEAVAAHEINGKTLRETAELAGCSDSTVQHWVNQYRNGQLDIAEFLSAYRARLVSSLAELQAEATRRALEQVPEEGSALKAALTGKAAGEMLRDAAGEPDIRVQHNVVEDLEAELDDLLRNDDEDEAHAGADALH